MSKLLTLGLASAAVASGFGITPSDENTPAVTQALVDKINSIKTTWKAAIPIKFSNATVADIKNLLGTILPHEKGYY